MKNRTKPSASELVILKALWKLAPQSAREIHNAVEEKLEWSYSSTRKTLERMNEKHLLSVSEVHGIRVFHPAVNKVKTLARYIKDFTQSVLEVDGQISVSMFADSKLLNEDELVQLEKTLQQKDES